MVVGLPGGVEGGCVVVVVEEGGLAGGFEGCPVAANDAVVGNDGLENAAVVVGAMGVLPREDNVAALVADEVFIVGGNEQKPALPEPPCAAMVSEVEVPALIFLHMNAASQQGYALAAVVDVQS